MNRITQLSGLLTKENTAAKDHIELKPKYKHNWFKENGWGFKDTEFSLTKEGQILLTGSRYLFSGQVLPHFRPWAEKVLGLDLNAQTPAQPEMPVDPPILNKEFLDAIKPHVDEISSEKSQRIMHSHGHSMQEIFDIRHRKMARTVDVVVYINSHEQAEKLVKFAVEHNVCLIPYGGGTNVTHALVPLQEEKRMIVSVDVTRMNHVKWVDRKNMKACVEAGIIGKDLERELGLYGLVLGHEPDSVEFSSLGGWVSTRASGMKKNVYGNIEDIVMQVKVATPIGTVVKLGDAPRISSGPDIDEIIMGSEGTIGIITEVILKVRETPPVKEYHSLIFHDFETGTKFMHDVAKSRIWPASIRLVDNTQFQFALSIRPEEHGFFKDIKDKLKKVYLEKIAGLDLNKIAVVTIVFEGSKESTEMQKKSIDALGAKYHALSAGKEAGERGYFLTFMIAYLRDYGFNYSYVAESFETSVAWTQVITMCKATEQRIIDECKKRGVKKAPWISFRVTQVYDTGAAVYVYFGFHYGGLKDPVKVYSEIEDCAREEVMKNGGSISHHHGVGKLRKIFLKDSIGDTGLTVLKGVKKTFDPTNIFANGNLV